MPPSSSSSSLAVAALKVPEDAEDTTNNIGSNISSSDNNNSHEAVKAMIRRLVDVLTDDEVMSFHKRWSSSSSSSPPSAESNADTRTLPASPVLGVATVCSGTDAPIIALELLLEVINSRVNDIVAANGSDATSTNAGENKSMMKMTMKHVFSCENVKFKQEFIRATTNPPIIFNDVTELAKKGGDRTTKCSCHDGTKRHIPDDFNVLVAGTECVDFSPLSSTPKGLFDGGKSGITFRATYYLAKSYRPSIVVLENVAKCPSKKMKSAFEKIGYVGTYATLNTKDYLLPQSRPRVYFVFLLKGEARFIEGWDSAVERLGANRPSLPGERPLAWTDFLIDDADQLTKFVKKKKMGKSLANSKRTKWLAEITRIEKKDGLPRYDLPGGAGRPYSDATAGCEALAHIPDRGKMRLDVQCKRSIKAGIDPFQTPLLWNPGQQLRFTDKGYVKKDSNPKAIAPCVTPGHEWVISSCKRPFTGPESLSLQGIPVAKHVLKEFTDRHLRDLAGNAMSTTVVAASFLSLFMTSELIASNDGSSQTRKRLSSSSSSDDNGQRTNMRARSERACLMETGQSSSTPNSKRQKKGDDALKRRDVSLYFCRFRHCESARSPSIRKEFPSEAEIMLQLRNVAGTSNNNKAWSCSALRDFIKAYGVERNFPGMTAENVMPLLPIVQHLKALKIGNQKRLDVTVDPTAVVQQVDALADLCKAEGFTRNLSFASKALNMLGHNVPIYSSECKEYLGMKSCSDYGKYLSKWLQELEANRALYEDEATQILNRSQDKSKLEAELDATWFAIRGLDQMMCRIGAPKQVQLLCPTCQEHSRNRQS